MKTTYILRDPDKGVFAAAIADTSPARDLVSAPVKNSYLVTRINVMEQYRGKGYGNRILKIVIDDADKEGATLYIEPVPYGPLDREALESWYKRNGFTWDEWIMVRRPNAS